MRVAAILLGVAVVVGAMAWSTRYRWAPSSWVGEPPQTADFVDDAMQAFSDPASLLDGGDAGGANVRAFLDAIAWAEGTAGRDGYSTLFGGATFDSFDDHPAVLGWKGVPLSDSMCAGAGMGPGCVSTAAGRYQINKPTWLELKRKLALPDFSPASQDAAAVELIRQRGALSDLSAGNLAGAVDKVRRVWASLPGAGYGQGERSFNGLATAYASAGGMIFTG